MNNFLIINFDYLNTFSTFSKNATSLVFYRIYLSILKLLNIYYIFYSTFNFTYKEKNYYSCHRIP